MTPRAARCGQCAQRQHGSDERQVNAAFMLALGIVRDFWLNQAARQSTRAVSCGLA
jgi:hypothetical protein